MLQMRKENLVAVILIKIFVKSPVIRKWQIPLYNFLTVDMYFRPAYCSSINNRVNCLSEKNTYPLNISLFTKYIKQNGKYSFFNE